MTHGGQHSWSWRSPQSCPGSQDCGRIVATPGCRLQMTAIIRKVLGFLEVATSTNTLRAHPDSCRPFVALGGRMLAAPVPLRGVNPKAHQAGGFDNPARSR
jgi:hypothetical protein